MSVPLFSNRSQMMSKCGQNEEEAHEPQVSVSLVFVLKYSSVSPSFLLENGSCQTFFEVFTCLIRNNVANSQNCMTC